MRLPPRFKRTATLFTSTTLFRSVLSQQARGLECHFTSAELQSIADTAHSLGLKVMAHAHGAGGITASAAAGIDSIEHGTFADDATLKVMKAKGTYLVPTLMAFEGIRERLGKGRSDERQVGKECVRKGRARWS